MDSKESEQDLTYRSCALELKQLIKEIAWENEDSKWRERAYTVLLSLDLLENSNKQ